MTRQLDVPRSLQHFSSMPTNCSTPELADQKEIAPESEKFPEHAVALKIAEPHFEWARIQYARPRCRE